MIFVTVGTTLFPFCRMVDVVKRLAKERKKEETIVFQHGNTRCDIKKEHIYLYKHLPFSKMEQYIRQARVIVTHGGPATIYQTLAAGKVPYVLPREKRYGEHINDHQTYFCHMLESQRKIVLLNLNVMQSMNRSIKYKAQSTNLPLTKIIEYLESISSHHGN
jgi:UDP-N-acetylglucosamine transferase subunit ALG13